MIRRLRELYRYRDLLRNLVIRDLKVRYKNSVLGILWSLLNPLLMTMVFTVVFTLMLPSKIANFPVFFMSGFLPWTFFASSVTSATGSIVNNAGLIKKVYFPREILPIADVLSNLVHLVVAFVVLFALVLAFGMRLTPAALMLPLIVLAEVMFITGMALLLSTMNVFYRDTEHIWSIVLQAWFFLTPIFYSIALMPQDKIILGVHVNIQLWARRLNPMASLVASYQDVLYWGSPTGWDFFLRTFATCFVVLVIGYTVFARYSHRFGEEA
jgi:ABC-type polysaccharide/polyol phosphate export permease